MKPCIDSTPRLHYCLARRREILKNMEMDDGAITNLKPLQFKAGYSSSQYIFQQNLNVSKINTIIVLPESPMPIYEFECENCHKITEVVQSISSPPLAACPACQSKVKKLISQSSFHLKGGGWYADGYSAPAKKEKAPKETPQSCPKSQGGSCPCAAKSTD